MSFRSYEAYRDSGVERFGHVPASWTLVPLKRIATIRYGIGEPPAYREEGVPLIRATNIHAGHVLSEGILKVDPSDMPNGRALWLSEGDIIVVRSGAYTGDSGLIRRHDVPSIAGFDMVVRPSGCDPEFLQNALLSQYLKERQIDIEKMRAAQPHLNAEELGSCVVMLPPRAGLLCHYLGVRGARGQIELSASGASDSMLNIGQGIILDMFVPLPPVTEQAEIVASIKAELLRLDALADSVRSGVSLLSERRAALISAAVTGKIDGRGLVPTEIPAP